MSSAVDGVRQYWERLRRQGIWPVPIWFPDASSSEDAGEPDLEEQEFTDPTSYDWFDTI